jgi:hypothetical protein
MHSRVLFLNFPWQWVSAHPIFAIISYSDCDAQKIYFPARRLEISLNHNLLTGTLPLERFERYLQNESPESPFRIKTLDISFNFLTGTVNPIAPLIPSLTYFDLSHNRLQGQVRPAFSNIIIIVLSHILNAS